MYEVTETEYGFELTVDGTPDTDQIDSLIASAREAADSTTGSFGVVADFRDLTVFPQEAADELEELMRYCDDAGMERSATVVDAATTKMQLDRLVENSGIDDRIVDASDTADPLSVAEAWAVDGVEPS
ncbi:hypothetical protein RYH80_16405 [Halobaculum sp. MBLA0147]|uniref:hypothetical protein n=1 Tax=Halobaculum sp. MBLA0147 TaxID=3079934 RepID=UPI00352661DC